MFKDSTGAMPHDSQSRRYFCIGQSAQEAERQRDIAERLDELREEIHEKVEAMGDGFLYEQARYQVRKLPTVRALAERVMDLCDEYEGVERHGI